MKTLRGLLGAFVCLALWNGGAWAEIAKPAEAKDSGKPEPKKVGDEADLLLQQGIVFVNFDNDELGSALGSTMALRHIPFAASKIAGAKRITVKIGTNGEQGNSSIAEVLRLSTGQAQCTYRVVGGKVLVATKEEWEAIDAKKAEFEAWKPKEAAPLTKEQIEAERKQREADEGEALKQVKVVRDAAGTKYEFMGKTWPEADFKKDFPDFYAKLKAKEATADSGKPEPQKVGDEAQLLLRKVTLEMVDVPLCEAIEFMNEFVKVDVSVSKGAGAKPVTLKLQKATLAEALRQIKDQAGAVHRVVGGKLLIASPEEWKEIDAGTAKFEASKSAEEKP